MNKKSTFSTLRMLLCSALVLALVASCSNFLDFQEDIGNIKKTATYTITYNLNDGTQNATNPASYTIETDTISLADPTRATYYFAGWYENVGLTGDAVTTISKGSTGNKTFWAAWSLVPVYIVTFDGAEATTEANPATMTVTDPATTITALPTAPEKTGYTFAGWYTQENGLGTAFTASTTVSATMTVYAKWTPIVYTISYNLNDGTQNATNPASYTIEIDTITLADPTRATYYFAGWYENVGLTGDAVTTISKGSTGNKTFWAAWSLVPVYIVTFDGADATTAANPATMTVTDPATTITALPTAPEKTGYTFGGWYTQENGLGTAFTASTTVSATMTVYAKWTPIVYTITYNLNGGTNHVSNPTSYTVETDTITLATPTRAGYAFDGWFDDAGFTGTAVTTIPKGSTGNKSFWAAWSLVPVYIVTFDGADATTAANPATMTVTDPATTITVLPTAPEKNGYTFAGWYTQENGLGTAFTASTPVSATLTVYAKWTQIFHTITFNANNGSGTMTPQVIGETVTAALTANAFTRVDYTFLGWSTVQNAGEPTFTDTASYTMGAANVTLYAIWGYPTLAGLAPQSTASVSMASVASVDDDGYLKAYNGSPYSQATSTSTGFEHKIKPFTMGTYQVTYELWYTVRSWALLNGYTFANQGREGNDGTIGAAPTEAAKLEPVTTINWRDSMVWCNAYSQMAGKTPYYYTDASCTSVLKTVTDTGSINATEGSEDNPYVKANATGYRLPTEGEWQYAASCGGVYPYDYASGADAKHDATSGGSDIDGDGDIQYSSDVAWYNTNSSNKTQPVGTRAANKFGLYDMSGNVFEWCWDWYRSNPTEVQIDYKGTATGSHRISRGGSWSNVTFFLQVGYRGNFPPCREGYSVGFRITEDR